MNMFRLFLVLHLEVVAMFRLFLVLHLEVVAVVNDYILRVHCIVGRRNVCGLVGREGFSGMLTDHIHVMGNYPARMRKGVK